MKRGVILVLIFILYLQFLFVVSALEEDQVELAYSCLENRINQTGCSSLNFEEKVFSYLTVGKCGEQLSLDNSSNQCWPRSGCKLKSTAQAILALNKKVNTTSAEKWLLRQTAVPTTIDWYLEIEVPSGEANCQIVYPGSSPRTITIKENKTLSSGAGNYLTLSSGGYWLKIDPRLYNQDIYISCERQFITTLLFMKNGLSTVHVSESVHGAGAGGNVSEKVDSVCFAQNGACNYEGSLWAALVLASLDHDEEIQRFLPYLITMRDDISNNIYLPESFLYYLTNKFRTDLLLKQKYSSYWEESGNRYYDTALALLPLRGDGSNEKSNSISWILSVQQKSGCWNNGNIRDTAFLLYSIWSKDPFSEVGECEYDSDCPQIDCKYAWCENGNCMYEYDGSCVEIECTSDSQCPETEYSENFCEGDSIYREIYTYSCDTSKGICSVHVDETFIETCSNSEICDNGKCIQESCFFDFQCNEGYECVGGSCVPEGECKKDNDCPEEDCMEAECISGTCSYYYVDCMDGDDCCSPGCDYTNDDYCSEEPQCNSDSDCSHFNYDSDKFCGGDNVNDVYITYNRYTCKNLKCEKNEETVLFEDCSNSQTCYGGECNGGEVCECEYDEECLPGYSCDGCVCILEGSETCTDWWDCDYDEDCIDGKCAPMGCDEDGDCSSGKCLNGECVSETSDCEANLYYCTSKASCDAIEGNIMQDYSCSGDLMKCCDTNAPLLTCEQEGGTICSYDQFCSGGTVIESSDTSYEETCCVEGVCNTEGITEEDEYCEDNKGICRDEGYCEDNEDEKSYLCDYSYQACCIKKEDTKKPKGWIIIIILLILIVLAVLGIVFRDKVRTQWMKIKDKFSGKKPKKKFELPQSMQPNPQGRILPRRILPPGQGSTGLPQNSRFPARTMGPPISGMPPQQAPGVQKPVVSQNPPVNAPVKKPEVKPKNNDLDDVLKKLKEMGDK